MLRWISRIGVLAALASLAFSGCSSHSDSSAGLSLGLGPSGGSGGGPTAVVLAAGEGAHWQATPHGSLQPLQVGTLLPEGAVVESGDENGVRLLLPGGVGTVTLGSRTRVALNDLGPDGAVGLWVSHGRVEGGVTAGTLSLMNACGASLQLSPQPGMTAPFSFGNTLPVELWDAMVGLGMNPDVLLPPFASEKLLGQGGPQTFIAPVVVPEPGPVALAGAGVAALSSLARASRRRTRH